MTWDFEGNISEWVRGWVSQSVSERVKCDFKVMFRATNKKGKEYNMVFIQALEKNNFQQKLNFFI